MAFNVLVVDDSETIRSIIIKTLKIGKVPISELYQAGNGKEALEILNSNWIDLVLADINMPVMNGIEMVNRMYEDGILKTIPVIVVSTEGSSTRIEQLMGKGVSAYVRKPFTPESIKRIVEEIMGVFDEY
jgi:two-component system, chemotaxis family, chemotaxis protein CheY